MAGDDQPFVRRADFLLALSITEENKWGGVADWLGFEAIQQDDEPEPRKKEAVAPAGIHDGVEINSLRPSIPTRKTASHHSAYFRVKDRKLGELEDDEVDYSIHHPDWYTEASPTYFEETETRIPRIHRVQPEYPPLVPWSRLYTLLQRQLGENVAGVKPDISELVKQVVNGRQIGRIPRQRRFTWASRLRILVDINDSNFPYRKDFIHLREQLELWRGKEGLTVEYIHDVPGGKVTQRLSGWEQVTDWVLPARDEAFLILSDLSLHSQSRRGLYQWLAFGEMLETNGIKPLVLLPVAERVLDQQLLRYFSCVVLDKNSSLRPVPMAGRSIHTASVNEDQLVALSFPVLRGDLGLLRSLRYLLDAREVDVSHESAFWENMAIHRAGDEWGWDAERRILNKPKFIAYLKVLPEASKQSLVYYLGCHHAQLPDEVYFEAMEELEQLGLPLPDEVSQAMHDFFAMLVKTYDCHPDSEASTELDLWVKRYLARHDYEGRRGESEFQAAFMAIEYKRRRQRGESRANPEWPDDISSDDLLPFLNEHQVAESYILRQKGQQLELLHAETAAQESTDWGLPVTLLALRLRDTVLFYHVVSDDGEARQVSLHLEKDKVTTIPLPLGKSQTLQIGKERLSIDVHAANDTTGWMVKRGMEGSAVWAESKSVKDEPYRWYWLSPQWNRSQGLMRGVWSATPEVGEFARDQYGLYTDIELTEGIKQRFRWIEPTTFQMGSPEDEEGRSGAKTQHQVILSQGYWLADTACTQALWKAVMGDNPSHFKGGDNPVEQVSWEDVDKFLNRINKQQSDLQLRLPTEAEWENACRAGTETAFHFGEKDDLNLERVNYSGKWDELYFDSSGKTNPVKSYSPNQWGLYEMHGNVWEWCQDRYGEYPTEITTDPSGSDTGDYRVLRGGSWIGHGRDCRSAYRNRNDPSYRYNFIGFRLALGHAKSPVRSVKADQHHLGSLATGEHGGQDEVERRPSSSVAGSAVQGDGATTRGLWDQVKGVFKR